MKLFRRAAFTGFLFALAAHAAHAPLAAAPIGLASPAAGSHRENMQSVCHHYRWSSRRHCTGAKVLRHYDRTPKLHYPSRYYADRPHYYYEQRSFYWRSLYDRHRWFYGPYRYGWPYRYPYYW